MNRNDRRIALTAIAVGSLALIGLWLTEYQQAPETTLVVKDSTMLVDSIHYNSYQQRTSASMTVGEVPLRHTEEFPFDPNTADSTQLLRLGLQPWQVRSIYRFRARGGVFRTKRDFAELYGLTKKDYLRLEPYIRISDDYQPASTLFPKEERDSVRYPVKLKDGEHIVLNTADTTQLMKVPGIGSYYAKEIVRHGKWLGGYVSVDQLDEIADFPQASKKYFVVQQANPKKLNVNQLTLQQLRRHPYINYYQARAIKEYCRLHGPLKSLDDLRLSRDFPPEVIQRLAPYVTF